MNENTGREAFEKLEPDVKENLLMETAMRIQETFDDMFYDNQLNHCNIAAEGSLERLLIFRGWAREFEDQYCNTDKYNDDFLWLSSEFAEAKIKEQFR